MKLEQLNEFFKDYQNGSFVRLVTEAPVSVQSKLKGYFSVKKRVETTVRFGVRYTEIAAVKAMETATAEAVKPLWWHNVSKYVRANNKDPNKLYLSTFTVAKNSNTTVRYYVNGQRCDDIDFIKSITIASAWSKSGDQLVNYAPSIDHVVSLSQKRNGKIVVVE